MRCPACQAPNPPENQRCQNCGAKLLPRSPVIQDEGEVLPVLPASVADTARRPPRSPLVDAIEEETGARRSTRPGDPDDAEGTDVVAAFIPYRNPKALAAYYCGFFALIPALGFILGVAAIVLGVLGVRYASANPGAKGLAHAITGIVLGVVGFFCVNPLVCFLLWFDFWYKS